jgi:hypothetical protein
MSTDGGSSMIVKGVSGLLAAAALTLAVPAQAALLGRDLNGSPASFEAYYDDLLDITWLADWNYSVTSGFDGDGAMYWEVAAEWIASLNAGAGLYGFTDWRLPNVAPVNGVAYKFARTNNGTSDLGFAKTGTGWGLASEMGHLFYVTLGNKGFCTPDDANPNNAIAYFNCDEQAGWGLQNKGPFSNMDAYYYWAGPLRNDEDAWSFDLNQGDQDDEYTLGGFVDWKAVVVRNGDVLAAPVPESGSLALLLTGLGALGWVRRWVSAAPA